MKEIKDYLKYDPETGVFTWKEGRPGASKGKRAGFFHKRGYRYIGVNNKRYQEHRLAFCMMGIEIPKNLQVDHINGNPIDNRWCNLRLVTQRDNCNNMALHRNGHLAGTSYIKGQDKWKSKITINKKAVHLGCFKTQEEAHQAYLAAKEKL